MTTPTAALFDPRYSSPNATEVPWEQAEQLLNDAEVYWITTISRENRPHVVPLLGVWDAGALHFTTGEGEQKEKNVARHPQVVLSTGTNRMAEGFDVMVEGEVERVLDTDRLQQLADLWVQKYGEGWRYDVVDDGFIHSADSVRAEHRGKARVFTVKPRIVRGFERGHQFAQMRWELA